MAYSAPIHYVTQCWVIVNCTIRNKLQWNFDQNTKYFIHRNAPEYIFCEMATILSRETWVNVAHSLQDWRRVRAIAGQSGENSLKVRCVNCEPASIPTEMMDLVREVINKEDLSVARVRCVSSACAVLAHWVRDGSCPALIWIQANYKYELMGYPNPSAFVFFCLFVFNVKNSKRARGSCLNRTIVQ